MPHGYDLTLEEVGPRKIQVIKLIVALTPHGLKGAKDLADSAPALLFEDLDEDVALDRQQQLEAVGAVVSLQRAGQPGKHFSGVYIDHPEDENGPRYDVVLLDAGKKKLEFRQKWPK